MATHSFHSYSPNALVYDPNTGSFTLDSDFDHREDRNFIEVTDDDAFFDGDKSNDEVGEDSNQTAVVRDGDGNVIGSGQVYVEQYAILQAPDGTQITIDRIEIDGVHMGYIPSALLQPGVQYTYVGGDDVDNGGDPDGNGGTTADTRANYSYYETNSVPCYCSGTMIETEAGLMPVDWVSSQDKVLTKDKGYRPVLWVGRRVVSLVQLKSDSSFWPVTIRAGALGNGVPAFDLEVSPDHRILMSGPRIELLFGVAEVFVPAKGLVNGTTVTRSCPETPVSYYHILCSDHELLQVEGVWAESLLATDESCSRLSPKDRQLVIAAVNGDLGAMKSARMSLKMAQAAVVRDLLSQAEPVMHPRRA